MGLKNWIRYQEEFETKLRIRKAEVIREDCPTEVLEKITDPNHRDLCMH